jgi:hypothetical protein
MHVLGDTRPLAQPGLIGDQLLLALQLIGALPAGPDKLLILAPEPAHEPWQHRGGNHHGHQPAGQREPSRNDGQGHHTGREYRDQCERCRRRPSRPSSCQERGDGSRDSPPQVHQAQTGSHRGSRCESGPGIKCPP